MTGQRIPLDADELTLIARLDAREWIEVEVLARQGPLDASAIQALARRGGVLSDLDDEAAEALREGEPMLRQRGWHPQAAVFHAMTQWTDVTGDGGDSDVPAERERRFADMVRKRGMPPPHFFQTGAYDHVALPAPP